MNIPLIEIFTQHKPLRNEINTAIQSVLDRGDFILGYDVARLEEEFAAYCGTKYAIGVDSGLSALELSLRAFGIGPGHEVILSAYASISSPAAVVSVGAIPIFVDIEPETWNMDVEKIEEVISPRTRAIIPFHLFGLPVDMHMVLGIAEKYKLIVIEDVSQAPGAMYKGHRVGGLSNAAGFSFHPTRILGACGDAGMVTTNDARVFEKIRTMRNYGQKTKNQHELPALNRRMDTLQAAILRVKLKYLDEWLYSRRRLSGLYNELLSDSQIIQQVELPGYQHVYNFYAIRVKERDMLRNRLKENKIETVIHYPVPVYRQSCFVNPKNNQGHFPTAEKLCKEILSLPMYPELTEEQVEFVACKILKAG